MIFKNTEHTIRKIYQNIVEISRSKFFYIDFELDDSFETRFDLIICSMILKIILEKWDLVILQLIRK